MILFNITHNYFYIFYSEKALIFPASLFLEEAFLAACATLPRNAWWKLLFFCSKLSRQSETRKINRIKYKTYLIAIFNSIKN